MEQSFDYSSPQLHILFFTLLFFYSSHSHANVYTWIDKNGNINYSQTPVNNKGQSLSNDQSELDKALESLANQEQEKQHTENLYHQTMCYEARKTYKSLKQQLKIRYIEQKNESNTDSKERLFAKIEQIKREIEFCDQNNY